MKREDKYLQLFLFFALEETMGRLERDFQPKLIERLKNMFPGCVVIKNDPNYIQGFPDLTVLYKDRWAVLEVKRDPSSSKRPNQDYYINKLGAMSFSAFIFPENMEEVLSELQRAFESDRPPRISKSK